MQVAGDKGDGGGDGCPVTGAGTRCLPRRWRVRGRLESSTRVPGRLASSTRVRGRLAPQARGGGPTPGGAGGWDAGVPSSSCLRGVPPAPPRGHALHGDRRLGPKVQAAVSSRRPGPPGRPGAESGRRTARGRGSDGATGRLRGASSREKPPPAGDSSHRRPSSNASVFL